VDTNASIAQLDKLLIQITPTNALSKEDVTTSHTDFQETPLHAVDARDATGHNKSQTQSLETDVLIDQNQSASVTKDTETKDTHAFLALSDRSEVELTTNNVLIHQAALDPIKSNLLLITKHAVDARPVNTQHSSQIAPELNVLPDQ
jgi:hypothetical protein